MRAIKPNKHLPRRTLRAIAASKDRLLAELNGCHDIVFVPLRGNMGDKLLWAGTRALLRNVRYREVHPSRLDDVSGQLALMAGSGGWCKDFHGFAPDILQRLESRFERVVVLPSTYEPSFALIAEIMSASRSRFYAREEVSRKLVEPFADVATAHDTAFFFDYTPYFILGEGTLHAMREDHASATDWSKIGIDPASNVDISLKARTMDEWLWTIARSRNVVTDRAHVMIAAAMLGKQVTYYPTTDHKVPAIASYQTSGLDLQRGEVEGAGPVSISQ